MVEQVKGANETVWEDSFGQLLIYLLLIIAVSSQRTKNKHNRQIPVHIFTPFILIIQLSLSFKQFFSFIHVWSYSHKGLL